MSATPPFPTDALQSSGAATKDELRAFLIANYKHDRLLGRGDDYAECVVDSNLARLASIGYGCISSHEHCGGKAIFFDRQLQPLHGAALDAAFRGELKALRS